MPLYDYKCEECKLDHEVFKKIAQAQEPEACPSCGKTMIKQIQQTKVRLFRAGMYEHIAYDPIQINSMKQLKAECKKHGVTSAYAEDIC